MNEDTQLQLPPGHPWARCSTPESLPVLGLHASKYM